MRKKNVVIWMMVVLFIAMFFVQNSVLAGTIRGFGPNYGVSNTPIANDFVAFSGGLYHGVGLKSDGSIASWGSNLYDQVGHTPDGNDFVAVSAGGYHSLALKSDGSVVAWGGNSYGQCNVPSGSFIAVSAGEHFSAAITSDGSLVAWGSNSEDQLNNIPPGNDFVKIDAGAYHTLALRSDGSIVAWGQIAYGQCNVPLGDWFVDIAAGGDHSLALKSDGSLAAWGRSGIQVPIDGDFISIAAGSGFSAAMKSNGSLFIIGGDYWDSHTPRGYFAGISAGYGSCLVMLSESAIPQSIQGDLNDDGSVNFADLSILTSNWLEGTGVTPAEMEIIAEMAARKFIEIQQQDTSIK